MQIHRVQTAREVKIEGRHNSNYEMQLAVYARAQQKILFKTSHTTLMKLQLKEHMSKFCDLMNMMKCPIYDKIVSCICYGLLSLFFLKKENISNQL